MRSLKGFSVIVVLAGLLGVLLAGQALLFAKTGQRAPAKSKAGGIDKVPHSWPNYRYPNLPEKIEIGKGAALLRTAKDAKEIDAWLRTFSTGPSYTVLLKSDNAKLLGDWLVGMVDVGSGLFVWQAFLYGYVTPQKGAAGHWQLFYTGWVASTSDAHGMGTIRMDPTKQQLVVGGFRDVDISKELKAYRQLNSPPAANEAAISRILGITIEQSTIEQLEKKLGPGAPCISGHAHGGRAWYLKTCRVWVYADGFNYGNGGRIIDYVQMSNRKDKMDYGFSQEFHKPKIPVVGGARTGIGWLGRVLPGMSKAEVLKAAGALPKPQTKQDSLVWSSGESHKPGGPAWSAELTFEKDKLVVLKVEGPGL